MTYSEKLKDPRWQRKRLEILERDGWACRNCGSVDKTLHVHHVHYQKGEPWETASEFLLTVCWECHQEREALETEIKESFARILTGLGHIEDEDHSLLRLRDQLLNVEDVMRQKHNLDSVFITTETEYEWKTDIRWYNHAHDTPNARKAYDSVMGTKIKWPSRKKEAK